MTVVPLADSPRRAVAHRTQELVEVAPDEPALTAGRPVDGDESLVRPLAQRRGAHADVGSCLANVEKPWNVFLKHRHSPYFGPNCRNLDARTRICLIAAPGTGRPSSQERSSRHRRRDETLPAPPSEP